MIFFAFSWSTSLDQRSSVGIFFLSTSVPEIEIPFDDISWTIGPRGSVSEITLLHFGIRVDRRWNHPSILYRWGCVLLESRGCSLLLGEILEIWGRVYVPGDVVAFRNTRRMPLEPSLYLFSFRLCTLGRWCFGEISEKSEKSKKSQLYESIQEVEKRTLDL